jgi:hypothetical protein
MDTNKRPTPEEFAQRLKDTKGEQFALMVCMGAATLSFVNAMRGTLETPTPELIAEGLAALPQFASDVMMTMESLVGDMSVERTNEITKAVETLFGLIHAATEEAARGADDTIARAMAQPGGPTTH